MRQISADLNRKPEGMKNMKIKKCGAAILAAVMILTAAVLPGGALAETTGVVKGGWLILRSAPSFNGQVKSSYPSGTIVQINGQTGSWYAVTAPDGLSGYMLGDYLQVYGSGGSGNVPQETTGYVTSANGLNVKLRSGPGKGYSILASYAPGTKCTILSAGKNWCRIQIGSFTGYMMTQFLTNTPSGSSQPQSDIADGNPVYVTSKNGKGVNLRSGPDKAYASIGYYSVGTSATVITKGATWSYIKIGNRYGYMMTQFLTATAPASAPAAASTGAYVVSANGRSVNLRSSPTTASAIIRSFRIGTGVTVIARGNDWYFVQIEGCYGYMMRQFIYDGGAPATTTDLGF